MAKRFFFSREKKLTFKSIVIALVTAVFLAKSWGQELDLLNCSPKGDLCKRVKCAPLLPCEGIVHPNGSRCECCPVCVTLLDENMECPDSPSPKDGPVHSTKCKSGLVCENGICKKNDTSLPRCLIDRENRETGKEKFPKEILPNRQLWSPECDADGYFKIKQCQRGRCFCVDRVTGLRIFGQQEADLAQNMTCSCSHTLHERRKLWVEEKREAEWQTYAQEHCTTAGDYENLQCFKDTCFCVNPQTGVPYGTMVKIKQRNLLPCYEAKLHKESYLTRCEKQLMTERRILYDVAQKNITVRGLIEIGCDPDGSFERRMCKPEICYCSDRDGTSFGVYKKDRLDGQSDNIMQCRCARDEEDVMHNNARYERLKCDQYGNFAVFQCFGDVCFCVDMNGDKITEDFNLAEKRIKNVREECIKLLMLLGQPYYNTSTYYYSNNFDDIPKMSLESTG